MTTNRAPFALLLLLLACAHAAAAAAKSRENATPSPTPPALAAADSSLKLISLRGMVAQIEKLQQRQRGLRAELSQIQTAEERQRAESDLAKIGAEIDETRRNFSRFASGIDINALEGEEIAAASFNLQSEVQSLLHPLISELKEMTKRPRTMDKLRAQIRTYEEALPRLNMGIENVDRFTWKATDERLLKALAALRGSLLESKQRYDNKLDVSRIQLDELERQKKPIFETGQELIKVFFRSRGRNFSLAVLSFFGVFIAVRLVYKALYRASYMRHLTDRRMPSRILDISFYAITIIGSTVSLLVVLYLSGDWVLLSVASLFVLGLLWTARQYVPKAWQQMKMLLNLGTVREGERIIYLGLPWRVAKLNVYTTIENPAFEDCRLRLSLSALADLHSRLADPEEPWFPTARGDWVLVDDCHAQVLYQSPEAVLLRTPLSTKHYDTRAFIAAAPTNLSRGFRVTSTFGIDYKHQRHCTSTIREALEAHVRAALVKQAYGSYLRSFEVDFCCASASSLDYLLTADFDGAAASAYRRIARDLQRFAVEASTAHDWEIPFAQLTVHRADAA